MSSSEQVIADGIKAGIKFYRDSKYLHFLFFEDFFKKEAEEIVESKNNLLERKEIIKLEMSL
jgi:hypothetical protein